MPVKDGFAVPMLVDQKPPRDAEFDEVRSQVVNAVKLEQAQAQVQQIANQIASGAANAGALAAAASGKGLKAIDSKSYIIGSPLGQGPSASTSEELENALLGMKEGDVTKQPIKVGDNYYIVAVTKREEPSNDDFAKQHDQLKEQMLQQKRGTVFSDYLASTRQKLESDGKIVIYKEVLEKIDEADKPAGGVPEE